MAIDKFKPEIWAQEINYRLREALVALGFINRNYEGEIKDQGDTVHIIRPGSVTVTDYTGADFVFDDLSDEELELIINQAKMFAFQIKDIDQAQANQKLMTSYLDEANFSLSEVIDTKIFDTLADDAHSDNIITVTLTKSNVYATLVDAYKMLSNKKVPKAPEWQIAMPADVIALAKQSAEFIGATELGEKVKREAVFGKLAGFTIFETPNVKKDLQSTYEFATVSRARATNVATIVTATAHGLETGDDVQVSGLGGTGYATSSAAEVTVVDATSFTYANTGDNENTTADTAGTVLKLAVDLYWHLPFNNKISTTFADQIVKVEAGRREKNFADFIKGLHVFGIKTIKPEALGKIKHKYLTTAHS